MQIKNVPISIMDWRGHGTNLKIISKIKKGLQDVLWWRPRFAHYITSQLTKLEKRYNFVVDIWCGSGSTAIALASQNPTIQVLWCDIDEFFWWEDVPENFSYLQIPPNQLAQVLPKQADVIVAAGVIHHIEPENLNFFLRDIHDALDMNGSFIIHEHRISGHSIKGIIDKVSIHVLEFLNTRMLEWMSCAYNFFEMARLKEILNANGFRIIFEENTNGRFVTLPSINGNTVLICEKINK